MQLSLTINSGCGTVISMEDIAMDLFHIRKHARLYSAWELLDYWSLLAVVLYSWFYWPANYGKTLVWNTI